ncbi:MAG: hypothetical protein AAFR00_05900 [Pseudomonadota bacterium]
MRRVPKLWRALPFILVIALSIGLTNRWEAYRAITDAPIDTFEGQLTSAEIVRRASVGTTRARGGAVHTTLRISVDRNGEPVLVRLQKEGWTGRFEEMQAMLKRQGADPLGMTVWQTSPLTLRSVIAQDGAVLIAPSATLFGWQLELGIYLGLIALFVLLGAWGLLVPRLFERPRVVR